LEKHLISKRFQNTSVLDLTKEWITFYSTQIPPKHSSNTSLSSNTLDLDSSKHLITVDQHMVHQKNPPLPLCSKNEVSKTSISLGLETSRLGIPWFLVSLLLVWECQGREQKQLPVKILPYLYTARAWTERRTSSLYCKARLV